MQRVWRVYIDGFRGFRRIIGFRVYRVEGSGFRLRCLRVYSFGVELA